MAGLSIPIVKCVKCHLSIMIKTLKVLYLMICTMIKNTAGGKLKIKINNVNRSISVLYTSYFIPMNKPKVLKVFTVYYRISNSSINASLMAAYFSCTMIFSASIT